MRRCPSASGHRRFLARERQLRHRLVPVALAPPRSGRPSRWRLLAGLLPGSPPLPQLHGSQPLEQLGIVLREDPGIGQPSLGSRDQGLLVLVQPLPRGGERPLAAVDLGRGLAQPLGLRVEGLVVDLGEAQGLGVGPVDVEQRGDGLRHRIPFGGDAVHVFSLSPTDPAPSSCTIGRLG